MDLKVDKLFALRPPETRYPEAQHLRYSQGDEMARKRKAARDDYDSPWKEALVRYLPQFFELFFPAVEEQIDWTRPPTFLDKELRKMERSANLGKREADALVKVYRTDGEVAWVLIHIEIQAQWDADFALRMFISHYRIFDLHHKPVCSLAVLADANPKWRPSSYSSELWGTKTSFDFPIAKLQDFRPKLGKPGQPGELETSTNAFTLVVAATLYTQDTRPASQTRQEAKYSLTKALRDSGRSREEIRDLYRLIDWIMTLSPDQEDGFFERITAYEKENNMPPYISSIERRGIERGIERGRRASLVELLEVRFGDVPEALVKRLQGITNEEVLRSLLREAAVTSSLDQFATALEGDHQGPGLP